MILCWLVERESGVKRAPNFLSAKSFKDHDSDEEEESDPLPSTFYRYGDAFSSLIAGTFQSVVEYSIPYSVSFAVYNYVFDNYSIPSLVLDPNGTLDW